MRSWLTGPLGSATHPARAEWPPGRQCCPFSPQVRAVLGAAENGSNVTSAIPPGLELANWTRHFLRVPYGA